VRAEVAYQNALAGGVSSATLIQGAKQYAIAKQHIRYPQHLMWPANWLINKCWLEDPQPPKPKTITPGRKPEVTKGDGRRKKGRKLTRGRPVPPSGTFLPVEYGRATHGRYGEVRIGKKTADGKIPFQHGNKVREDYLFRFDSICWHADDAASIKDQASIDHHHRMFKPKRRKGSAAVPDNPPEKSAGEFGKPMGAAAAPPDKIAQAGTAGPSASVLIEVSAPAVAATKAKREAYESDLDSYMVVLGMA
jgi:hypothetical protein